MIPETFTILGANGFIGSALVERLSMQGNEVLSPCRADLMNGASKCVKGHVVYCIGLTSDFRDRPLDTVDAHVCLLKHVLHTCEFSSLTYLSSTRVYFGSDTGNEDSVLKVQPDDPDQIYNLSKLMGESLCHAASRDDRPVRVVRLSNVVGLGAGSENFIYTLMHDAVEYGRMLLKSSLDSSKDYVALADVIRLLELIARNGKKNCYNLASGIQITHKQIVDAIVRLTDAKVDIVEDAPCVQFPSININRIKDEFGFLPISPLNALG